MAIQPKKKKSPSKNITKKKPTNKKSTAKPRQRKRKKKSDIKRNISIALVLFTMLAFIGFGFYLGKNSDEVAAVIHSDEIEGSHATKKLLEDLTKIKAVKPKKEVKQATEHKSILKEKKFIAKDKTVKSKNTEVQVNNIKTKAKSIPKVAQTPLLKKSKKPRLAIVIDDVSKRSQIKAIKATGVVMTPAIFPPSELSMTSHHLAKGLMHAMIHLPMESSSRQFNTQYKTLLTHFSTAQIRERARELRRLFPDIRYVNNHTGSVFTANAQAMKKLYSALRSEGFNFIDSRTIGISKVRKIAHSFGDKYVSRDIFIDNIRTVPYIHKQLKKAVQIAKKKGYAVAIGHPHKVTMKALQSANSIFKDVELVYIDSIYKEK